MTATENRNRVLARSRLQHARQRLTEAVTIMRQGEAYGLRLGDEMEAVTRVADRLREMERSGATQPAQAGQNGE